MAEENVIVAGTENGEEQNGSSKAVTFLSLKPQIYVEAPKAADAIQFYKTAFGAVEISRNLNPKRKADQELPLILSAELQLGSSVFVVSDQSPNNKNASKATYDFCLETNNVKAAISAAVAAGALLVEESDENEGTCCSSKVKDSFGCTWSFCSIKSDTVAEA